MSFKLKNVLIVLTIISGLIFTSQVLADPSEKYDEIKVKLDSLTTEMNSCNDLPSGQEKIDCIDVVTKKMNEVMSELKKYESEIGQQAEELQKDIKSLKNQIGYLDAQVEKTEVEIRVTEQEISLINLDISKTEEQIKITEREIKNTENKIEETRQQLADSIKNLYEYDNQNLIELTLNKGNLSDFFDEIAYIENLQKGIGESLNKLKEDKNDLEDKKAGLEGQKQDLTEKKEEVAVKIDSFNKTIAELDASKREKAVLLEITKGDEEKYQELLAAIEKQKKELLGNLSALSQARQAEIEALVGQYGGRVEGSLFENPYYFAQNSGPWANTCINNLCPPTGGLMKDWGCAITSTAMVLKYYGKNVNPGILAENSDILYGILIKFPTVGNVYGVPCISGCSPTNNIDWSVVDDYLINKRQPVILMIKTSSDGTHFVVAIGKIEDKYFVYDPIYSVSQGKAVNLDVSIANIEKIYSTSASVTRMVIFSP